MNVEFSRFVQLEGGLKQAGDFIGKSESMASRIRSGKRRLSPELAKMICDKYPEISFSRLLLPSEQAA